MHHLKKLNARGVSHLIALMGIIVVSGIIGSYLLVSGHADSCTGTSDPTSSVTSGPTCPPSQAQFRHRRPASTAPSRVLLRR